MKHKRHSNASNEDGWSPCFLVQPKEGLNFQKIFHRKKEKNHTTFTLSNQVPIDNPWLHSTEKIKEEYSIGQVLILKSSLREHNEVDEAWFKIAWFIEEMYEIF